MEQSHYSVNPASVDSLSSMDEHVEHYLAEAAMMSNFNHLNVLGLIGVTCPHDPSHISSPHPQSPMIIMPFMSNGDLKKFISRRDLVSRDKCLTKVHLIILNFGIFNALDLI